VGGGGRGCIYFPPIFLESRVNKEKVEYSLLFLNLFMFSGMGCHVLGATPYY
jgi:hypothetical protein